VTRIDGEPSRVFGPSFAQAEARLDVDSDPRSVVCAGEGSCVEYEAEAFPMAEGLRAYPLVSAWL
jgi:hypothetical protein